jgi:hypothetical protein
MPTMVPGEKTAIKIDPSERKPPPLPWVFHLVATTSASANLTPDVEQGAVHCTVSAVKEGSKLRLYTAAHCLVMSGRKLPSSLWLRRTTSTPQLARLVVRKDQITFQSLDLQSWLAQPPTTNPVNEDVDRFLTPDPRHPEGWRPDVVAVDVDSTAWPATWQDAFPLTLDGYQVKAGAEVILAGGGCTQADLGMCRPTSSYAMYADVFSVSGLFGGRFGVVPPTDGSSRTQFGDSGGPVISGEHFLGVVSARFGTTTYIERPTGRQQ